VIQIYKKFNIVSVNRTQVSAPCTKHTAQGSIVQ